MHFLTEYEGPERKIFGSLSLRMDLTALAQYAMTSGQIFSYLAQPNLVNKYLIISYTNTYSPHMGIL